MKENRPVGARSMTRRTLLSAASFAFAAAGGLRAAPAQVKADFSANTEAFLDSVGVCGHFTRTRGVYPEQFDHILPELKALGVRHLRDEGIIFPEDRRESASFKRLRQIVASGLRLTVICFDDLNPYLSTPLDLSLIHI